MHIVMDLHQRLLQVPSPLKATPLLVGRHRHINPVIPKELHRPCIQKVGLRMAKALVGFLRLEEDVRHSAAKQLREEQARRAATDNDNEAGHRGKNIVAVCRREVVEWRKNAGCAGGPTQQPKTMRMMPRAKDRAREENELRNEREFTNKLN